MTTLQKFEQQAIWARRGDEGEKLFDGVVQSVIDDAAQLGLHSEDDTLDERKLRGEIKARLLHKLSLFSALHAPKDLDSERDIVIGQKAQEGDDLLIDISASEYLNVILRTAAVTSMRKALKAFAAELYKRGKAEREAGAAYPKGDHPFSCLYSCGNQHPSSAWALPSGRSFTSEDLPPLSLFVARALQLAVGRGTVSETEDKQVLAMFWQRGFTMVLTPALHSWLLGGFCGGGPDHPTPVRTEVSASDRDLLAALLAGKAYGCFILAASKGDEDNRMLLPMLEQDVPAVLDVKGSYIELGYADASPSAGEELPQS